MASADAESAQVRRIAILVTSLDATAGRQLLMAMPSPLARDVRKAMASLAAVDPDERRRVLAEFRTQALSAAPHTAPLRPTSSTSSAAVQPSPALLPTSAGPYKTHHSADAPTQAQSVFNEATSDAIESRGAEEHHKGESGRAWQRFDIPTLIHLLSGERATVIAVVLSQLPSLQAVGVLEQLPRPQQRTVLASLSRLGEIDPEAMRAIDDHLASRIADYGHQRASETETLGRMQELLAAASPELRGQWHEIIAETDHHLANRLGITSVSDPELELGMDRVAKVQVSRPSTAERPSAAANLLEMLASNVVTTADSDLDAATHADPDDGPRVLPFAPATPRADARLRSEQDDNRIVNLEQILELAPSVIARVLAAANGEIILLALAGATPHFMQRFTLLLEKNDARNLHMRLRKLGAINLQDIDEAQRRLCELATQVVAGNVDRRLQPNMAAAA